MPRPKPSTIAYVRGRKSLAPEWPYLLPPQIVNLQIFRNHALWVHEQQQEQEALLEKTRQETERLQLENEKVRLAQESIKTEQQRLQAEQAAREEERRLRELAAKKIPPLSPIQPPKPPPAQTNPSAPSPAPTAPANNVAPASSAPLAQPSVTQLKPAQPALHGFKSLAPSPFAAAATPSAASTATTAPTAAKPTPAPASAPTKIDPKRQRALQIHKNLKDLRQSVTTTQANQNPALKSKAGDMRREIRKCIGQLSFDKQGNQTVVSLYFTSHSPC